MRHYQEDTMRFGYIRVSTEEQNIERQEEMMKELGVDRIFIDKLSGKNTERPQLKEMVSFVREGDIVIVESISRIARNTKHLLEIIEILKTKKVGFVSKKETIDTTTPAGKFMLTVFGAIAELERAYLLDRQREGIEIAKRKGKYKGRKPIEVDETKWAKLYNQWKDGEIKAVQFRKEMNLFPATFYRTVRKWKKVD